MPRFQYKAVDAQGNALSGAIEASSAGDAVAAVEAQGYAVAALQRMEGAPRETLPDEARRRVLQPHIDKLFAHRDAIADALEAYAADLALGADKRQALAMARQLRGAVTADDLLSRDSARDAWIAMAAAGTATGNAFHYLPDLLSELNQHRRIQRQLAWAYSYPASILVLTAALFGAFSKWIAPPVFDMLVDFELQLPLLTQFTMAVSHWTQRYGLAIGLIVASAAGLYFGAQRLASSDWVDRWFGSLVGGSVAKVFAAGAFTRRLAELLEAGLSLPDALRLAGCGSLQAALRYGSAELAWSLEQGTPLEAARHAAQRLPSTVVAALCCTAGGPARVALLKQAAAAYAERAEDRSAQAWGASAPLAMLAVGLIVGLAIMSMFLPLIQVTTGFVG